MTEVAAHQRPPRADLLSMTLVAFVAVSALNVLATAADLTLAHQATKVLLVPLLLAWALGATARPVPRPTRALVAGLVFAWLGDLALMGSGQTLFISGIVMFLVMQVCYVTAFRRVPGPGLVRAWPLLTVPYLLVWVVLAALMLRGSGALAIPGLVYGLVLATMAISALDLVLRVPRRPGWQVAGGAGLFMLSDGLIALTAFAGVPTSPWLSAAVMATYTAAQGLIVTGFVRAVNAVSAATTPAAPPGRAAAG